MHVFHHIRLLHEDRQILLVDSEFTVLLRQIDLNQNILHFMDFLRGVVHRRQKMLAVHGMNQVEKPDRLLRLVRLQMPDQMPRDAPLQRLFFLRRLLHATGSSFPARRFSFAASISRSTA